MVKNITTCSGSLVVIDIPNKLSPHNLDDTHNIIAC